MKRLILILAASASLAALAPLGATAVALDDPRARPPHGDARSAERHDRRRDDHGPRVRSLRQDGPRAAPRRGGYLPDSARGDVVRDVERYRLRPPPRGFAWVRTGDGFALVSLADGRVYDVVR